MIKYIKILIYQFSTNKQKLDEYCRLFRKGHRFTDSEITVLKELIEKERELYDK